MAFNLDSEEQLADEFAKIPETTDVLLTHGPPKGVGRLDRMMAGASVGSQSLRTRILQLDAVVSRHLSLALSLSLREGCPRITTGVPQCWSSGHFRQVFLNTNALPCINIGTDERGESGSLCLVLVCRGRHGFLGGGFFSPFGIEFGQSRTG